MKKTMLPFAPSLPMSSRSFLVEEKQRRTNDCCRGHQNQRDLPKDISLDSIEVLRSDAYAGNPVKVPLLNLNLLDHRLVLTKLKVHVKMEMEIPRSSRFDSSDTDSNATLYSSSSDKIEEGANETDDADKSNMDLSNDNQHGDDDVEIFLDENAHHIPSLPAKKIPYPTTTPQPSTLQAKAKKLMQKEKKNIRKINFKKALKLLNRIHESKSNTTHLTHPTNQNLYDALYKYVCLDHDALIAQDVKPSFHKRSHDNQDSPNNHEGENKKKRQKDVGEPSSRSSRASTVAIAKKIKAIIQKEELTIADLEGVGLERLKQQYQNDVELEYHVDQLKEAVFTETNKNSDEDEVSKPRSFEQHMSKNTKPHLSFYNNDFYYLVRLRTKEKYTTSITKHYTARYYKQGIEDTIPDRWSKETHRYIFEALNDMHHGEESKIDFFKVEMRTRTEGSVYSDLRIKLVVRVEVKKKWGYGFLSSIVVRRSDDKEYQFSEVKKCCDGTLINIRENLVDMVKRNKLAPVTNGSMEETGLTWMSRNQIRWLIRLTRHSSAESSSEG
ncbi:hypothetical protein Tco_0631339 [Tanacetum coccineum]